MGEQDKRRIQEAELVILDEFARVCALHNIPFYLAYGTCLGAVRHKGFIPWDDDIDVFVFERDVCRLYDAMDESLRPGFFFQTLESDPGFNMPIRRLLLEGTTALIDGYLDRDMRHNLSIDIFPLYELAPGKVGRFFQQCWALLYSTLVIDRPPENHGPLFAAAARIVQRLLRNTRARSIAYSHMTKYMHSRDSSLCSNLSNNWMSIATVFPLRLFDMAYTTFEDRTLPIPEGYDEYLTISYGDYMTPVTPDEIDITQIHSFVFIDLDHSFEQYKGVKYLTE